MSRRDLPEAHVGPPYPWRIFWVLLVAALCGYVGVLPYLFAQFGNLIHAHELRMSLPVFVLVEVLQLTISFGLVVGLGLLLAGKVGLATPLLRRWLYGERDTSVTWAAGVRLPLIAGVATGAFTVLLLYGFFIRYLPGWPSEAMVPFWKRLLACFYGAVDEELMLRLFLLSLVLWIVQKITRRDLRSAPASFWTANILVALIFGAAHLPPAASIMQLTPMVIVAVVTLNTGAGIVFGHLAWTRGLEAAMLAHFSGDLVLHLIGPLFAAG